MEITFFILALAIFTGCSAFFSASETALFSLSSITVKTYKQHHNKGSRLIAKLLSRPKDLLVTILMMNITINIFVQNIASNLFGSLSGWSLRVGVPLLLTLIFGEIIPKSLALENNAWLAHKVAPTISFYRRTLGPVRHFITTITSYIYRILFFFLKKEESISKDELQHVLQKSKSTGVLFDDEARLIKGYLELQDDTIKERMSPREDIIFYETKRPLKEIYTLFMKKKCTRLPICEDGLDTVIGILSAHTFFLNKNHIHNSDDINKFLQKPFFVPENSPARILLSQFRNKKEDLALVVDEYGSVTGLVTEEDLIEVVIGPITDRRNDKSLYTEAGHGIIIASGKLELEEFERIFGDKLVTPNNMVTIGGWLTEQIGDIPKSGTKYIGDGFLFHVLAAAPNRVRRIYIRKLSSPLTSHDIEWRSSDV